MHNGIENLGLVYGLAWGMHKSRRSSSRRGRKEESGRFFLFDRRTGGMCLRLFTFIHVNLLYCTLYCSAPSHTHAHAHAHWDRQGWAGSQRAQQ